MRILLVEDDPLLGDGVQEGLREAGWTVDWITDGEAARTTLQADASFDGLVLDLGLPRLPGLDLLRWLRGAGLALPVLILTARDGVDDRIAGLNAGADDYLVKPFALGELDARLHALLRRANGRAATEMCWRDVAFDASSLTARRNGEVLNLTSMEARLLHLLLSARPRYLSREQIEVRLYGWLDAGESNSLDVHLSHLRKKLGAGSIENARGLGWRLA
ncbi:response regulator transcription factor [Jeongeupia naejangsanensis]|uniref:Response regulator transcription factor n=1 Tax=Jeongeupia naejangsanensis TaxID=613195 RepID=A0ABS2BLK1_9NEIS|nr:response regulator transcription factor [Jeongeupia naejangsanensis]MBM3116497.1 response regulator transcription factor [Jeongeupia naejangsanensis]